MQEARCRRSGFTCSRESSQDSTFPCHATDLFGFLAGRKNQQKPLLALHNLQRLEGSTISCPWCEQTLMFLCWLSQFCPGWCPTSRVLSSSPGQCRFGVQHDLGKLHLSLCRSSEELAPAEPKASALVPPRTLHVSSMCSFELCSCVAIALVQFGLVMPCLKDRCRAMWINTKGKSYAEDNLHL